MHRDRSCNLPSLRVLGAALLLTALAAPLHADVYTLKDGRTIDGRTLREKDDFVYVKTLTGTEKLAIADIVSRIEGEALVDRLDALRKAASADKKDVAAQWALCAFLREHADGDKALTKEAEKLLAKVLEMESDHKQARAANGDVWYDGGWIPGADLARRQAEAERRRVAKEWSDEVGISVEVEEGEHFILVCALEDADLTERIGQLDQAYDLIADVLGREELWAGKSPTIQMPDQKEYLRVVDHYAAKWRVAASWIALAKHEGGGGCWRVNPVPHQIRFPHQGVEALWFSQVHMVAHVTNWKLWGGGVPPAWIGEGLGQWVEYQVMGENLASCIGTPAHAGGRGATSDEPRGKKGDSKKGQGREEIAYRKERLLEAIGSGEFPAMRKFLGMQLGEFTAAEEGGAYGLVAFLRAKDRTKFGDLYKALQAQGAQKDEPWNVYGYELIEELEKDWKAWVLTEW